MEHFRSLEEAGRSQSTKGAWVTIGTFDGIHRGHQAILKPLADAAHAAGAPAVIVTFYPHPMVVLRGVAENFYLTCPNERVRLLSALGIDAVVTLAFDQALAALPAEEFMRQMSRALELRQLWVGDDFALGRNRQGDIPTLKKLGERLGFDLHVTAEVDEVDNGRTRISSSRIRELLRQGQAAHAARMIGRPYAIEGPVIHGDGRGRKLGFPTANIGYWHGKLIPAFGVYATWAWLGKRRIASVTSVGVRPTFDLAPGVPQVEAYLLDFNEDLYGQTVRVDFLEFLRPELRFDSAQALIDQMVLDTQNAREVLANAG